MTFEFDFNWKQIVYTITFVGLLIAVNVACLGETSFNHILVHISRSMIYKMADLGSEYLIFVELSSRSSNSSLIRVKCYYVFYSTVPQIPLCAQTVFTIPMYSSGA